MKRFIHLFFILILLALLLRPLTSSGDVSAAPSSEQSVQADSFIQVEDALTQEFETQGSAGYLIYFSSETDLSAASKMNWDERGQFVMETLQKAALDKQANVRASLDAQGVKYQSFWIDNVIAVDSSTSQVFNGLMAFPEIQSLKARRTMSIFEPERQPASESQQLLAVESNLTDINADDVWAMGYEGQNVTIANIDTGVLYTHHAVNAQYRGKLGSGVYNHNYNWLDPIGTYPTAPGDEHGSGTHTMGIMVGDDGNYHRTGVAPSADWMACRGCSSSGCPDTALLACAQFIAAPTDLAGANPDPDKRPVAVNNSWGDCGTSYDNWYQGVVDAWQAAGIFPIFSNGDASNCGYAEPPGLNTVGNPVRYGNVTGVGSSGQWPHGGYASHSNWGPTDNLDTVNPNPADAFGAALKPQVVAPGVNIRSSVNTSDYSYESWTGTSMSAAHVTGLVALIVDAAPCLAGEYATIETILEDTAVALPYNTGGSPAPPAGNAVNYATGHGEIDALAAVNMALGMCGESVLTGTVTNSVTGNPIDGVTVNIVNLTTNRHAITNAAGVYTVNLFDGIYDLTFSNYGYTTQTINGVALVGAATQDASLALATAPSSTISGVVTDAAAGWPLYARIDILGYPLLGSIYTNPVSGAYSVDLVAGSYKFLVTSLVPGYNNTVTPVTVAGNMTQDFALTARAACSAPGYAFGTPVMSEGFETAVPPAGWNKYTTGFAGFSTGGIKQGTTGTYGSHGAPHSGTYYAWHYNYHIDMGSATTTAVSWLVTPQITVPVSGASLTFWQRSYNPEYYWYHGVWVTTDASPDPRISTYVELWNGETDGDWSQNLVDLSAYAGQDVHLAFRYEEEYYADDWYLDDVAVTEPCAPIPGYGLVTGSVFDENTSLFVAGASVKSGSETALMLNASADPATPPEVYVISLPSGSQSVTASLAGYGDATDPVDVVSGGTVAHDFDLPTGQLSIVPISLTFNVTTGAPTDNENATLSNTGGAAAGYEIFAINGAYSAPVPGGPFADNTGHSGPGNLNDRTAENLHIFPTRPEIELLAAGDVVNSWNTGLTDAWGIGYNTTDADLWLGDIAYIGGTGYNTRFTTAGVNTGDSINTASWVSSWNADMTYNPYTQTLWQVNVGGDNCIYEMDPATLTNTGNKICPAFGIVQRGLAYDPVSDTYFSGSWNDSIINRFTPDGTLLSAVDVSLEIAGLAYNPVSQHLFVLSNTNSATTPTNYDITVLDAANNYAVVGGFNIGGATTVFADFAQAGLEIDCDGNLWAVDKTAQKVYVAESGETGVCGWLSTWLSVAPATGSVPATGSIPLTVSVDATGLAAGTYQGYLRILNNTLYGGDILPVTMNVANVIPAPWVGSVSIASDQNVVAVARPHLGSEVASYIGSSAGATTQYVPMLFKGAFGGTYNAALYLQNVSATAATLSLEFTDSSGAVVYTKTDTLDPHASKGYWLPAETGLPSGFAGGVKVTSTQPILAVGRPHINGQVMTYNGMSAGATSAWLPMFFKNGFGGNYNSALYIQNVTGSSANLSIEYINLDGTVACTDNDTLGANASKGYWSLAITCDTGSLPSGFVGGVKVTSTQNILAVGRAHLGTQITTYNGFPGGATSAYVPMLFKNAFSGGSYDAALYLQNVSGSSTAVTIEYLNSAGAVAATQNVTLAAKAISNIWLPSVAGLADGFAGGARITSTQDVIAVGRPHLGSEITAYNGAPAGSLNAHLPMLFKNAYGTYQSAFYVQNTSGSAANVEISFYDSAGVLSCVKSINLAAGASQGFWMPTVTCEP